MAATELSAGTPLAQLSAMRRFVVLLLLSSSTLVLLWLLQPALPGSALERSVSLRAASAQLQAEFEDQAPSSPELILSTYDNASVPESGVQLVGPRTPIATRKVKTPPLIGTKNFLLLGLDTKPGTHGFGRPDTILVVALSEQTKHVGLISIPRDLYVEIEDHGPDRINATYAAAIRNKKDPTEVMARVIEDTLALPIHHSLVVDLSAFEYLVDALGGVEVDVPCPIYDNFIDPRTATGRRILDVPEGRVVMDGITAGLYARSRHGRSDWNRARRQQAIVFGIKERLQSFDGFVRAPAVLKTLKDHVKSDLTRAELLALFSQSLSISRGDLHGLVLGA